ncbi:MAG: hypothetical protein U0871_13520 [Gemmataceae bacterium]
MTSLVKKLDETTAKSERKSGAWVVFLTDDPDKLEPKLKELAEKEKIKKAMLGLESAQGPPGYNLAKDADVTVVLYDKRKVVKTFAFAKGKLGEKDVDAITSAVKELTVKKDK